MLVKYGGSTDRRPNADHMVAAIEHALGIVDFTQSTQRRLQEGESVAQPIRSVNAKKLDDKAQARSDTFQITVTGFGPMLQRISDVMRTFAFLKSVEGKLLADGRTSLAQTSDTGSSVQVEGRPIIERHQVNVQVKAAGDVTDYGAVKKANVERKMAEVAGVDLKSVTVAVSAGSVILDFAIITDDPEAVKDKVTTALNTPDLASDALGVPVEEVLPVTYGAVLFNATPTPPTTDVGGVEEGPQEMGPASQTIGDEEVAPWVIFLVVLFFLLILVPVLCYYYARTKYGADKAGTFLRYKCSHSNPTLPFLYKPAEERERIRKQLHTVTKEDNNQGVTSPARQSAV
jgi:hypothetical protein